MNKKVNRKLTHRNFTLKLHFPSKVDRYETRSIRRFLNYVRTINWSKDLKKVCLRISYGKYLCGNNNETFYNDGEYLSKYDFDLAVKAFLEK